MKNKRSFLRCDVCGNLIGMIEDSGVVPVCCGQPMTLLEPNTTDAAGEKHVPVGKRDGDTLVVEVGSVKHPMTPEHSITWIALAQDGVTHRVHLTPDCEPSATFPIQKGPATLYAYCNLHGLWSSDLN